MDTTGVGDNSLVRRRVCGGIADRRYSRGQVGKWRSKRAAQIHGSPARFPSHAVCPTCVQRASNVRAWPAFPYPLYLSPRPSTLTMVFYGLGPLVWYLTCLVCTSLCVHRAPTLFLIGSSCATTHDFPPCVPSYMLYCNICNM